MGAAESAPEPASGGGGGGGGSVAMNIIKLKAAKERGELSEEQYEAQIKGLLQERNSPKAADQPPLDKLLPPDAGGPPKDATANANGQQQQQQQQQQPALNGTQPSAAPAAPAPQQQIQPPPPPYAAASVPPGVAPSAADAAGQPPAQAAQVVAVTTPAPPVTDTATATATTAPAPAGGAGAGAGAGGEGGEVVGPSTTNAMRHRKIPPLDLGSGGLATKLLRLKALHKANKVGEQQYQYELKRLLRVRAFGCPGGCELLKETVQREGWVCNVCSGPLVPGTLAWSCPDCDWDGCKQCLEEAQGYERAEKDGTSAANEHEYGAMGAPVLQSVGATPQVGAVVVGGGGGIEARTLVRSEDDAVFGCGAGHSLMPSRTTASYWQCNVCRVQLPCHALAYSCRECDWDGCGLCYARYPAATSNALALPQEELVQAHCVQGHVLKEFCSPDEEWACDNCRKTTPTGAFMFGCRVCNFDLCIRCLANKCSLPAGVPRAVEATAAGKEEGAKGNLALDILRLKQSKQAGWMTEEEYNRELKLLLQAGSPSSSPTAASAAHVTLSQPSDPSPAPPSGTTGTGTAGPGPEAKAQLETPSQVIHQATTTPAPQLTGTPQQAPAPGPTGNSNSASSQNAAPSSQNAAPSSQTAGPSSQTAADSSQTAPQSSQPAAPLTPKYIPEGPDKAQLENKGAAAVTESAPVVTAAQTAPSAVQTPSTVQTPAPVPANSAAGTTASTTAQLNGTAAASSTAGQNGTSGTAESAGTKAAEGATKAADAGASTEKDAAQKELEGRKVATFGCEGKHELSVFKAPDDKWSCNECSRTAEKGDVLLGCRVCDYDACDACYDKWRDSMVTLDKGSKCWYIKADGSVVEAEVEKVDRGHEGPPSYLVKVEGVSKETERNRLLGVMPLALSLTPTPIPPKSTTFPSPLAKDAPKPGVAPLVGGGGGGKEEEEEEEEHGDVGEGVLGAKSVN